MVPRVSAGAPSPPPSYIPPSSPKPYSPLSSASEADDERSSSVSGMGEHTRPQYQGEDTRLTSRKELAGFYIYGWAAEVFVVCGVGSFIPITLEQLARERGVLQSDKTTPCKPGFEVPASPGFNYTSSASPSALVARSEAAQCVVYLRGWEINTASFAMYTFSISVLLQALLIISMSGAADHGQYRKKLLLTFAFTGSVATMLFLPIVPKVFYLGALLAIIANTCFGASFVLLNSFLPVLVRRHPTVQHANRAAAGDRRYSNEYARVPSIVIDDDTVVDETADSTSALLPSSEADFTPPNPRSAATPSPELQLSTKISSYGIGIGYLAALLVQTLSIFVVVATGSSTFSLRLVLFIIGAWWFIFSIPAAFWLRPRPGPPLNLDFGRSRTRICFAYFSYAWKSLGKTAMRARKLKDVLLFLGAWFLLSDGIATVSGTAVLFAKTSLNMKPAALALINVVATLAGVIGAFTWSKISILMGLKPSHTILACICIFEIIPIYGLLGYLPAIRRLGVFGLQQPWEMYPLGAVYGFILGGLSSYCRSLFGELIPPGFEAAFYALYAITDKGSSVFGPAIVGAITDATGEIRPAFWFLAVLIGLPFPLMLLVDVERGRGDGVAMAKELNESKGKGLERIGSSDSGGPIHVVDAEELAGDSEHESEFPRHP